jgi:hypothetical protein
MSVLDEVSTPLPALTLTLKVEEAPAAHLTYDPGCPIAETAVTVLDQADGGPAWSFSRLVATDLVFLLLYMGEHRPWPAELRAPCAGRTTADEPS